MVGGRELVLEQKAGAGRDVAAKEIRRERPYRRLAGVDLELDADPVCQLVDVLLKSGREVEGLIDPDGTRVGPHDLPSCSGSTVAPSWS
jgi:hypothetical protein